ncbi:LLM class flavin-dependent oxidoreductase [Rhodococcus erythropolis]|uniref:LLM class flavin-dependent oxidoreductase n=1 Tax=Rhodococcus erythropolis TaxID=1833 RepID=UPI0022264B01|nr:LLM class flavin-dependent oxidoreductase [Rhodococcus erythropolis]
MDYGHPVHFGTLITPRSDAPHIAVQLAQLSEKLGYEVATFRDHPYEGRLLDTWTLLSWVAGRTSTIHLAPNASHAALRPPSVLARAAASLDLLSHGRVDLALGAGANWDAIAAMGAEKLTSEDSLQQLSEAIEVIRQTLATANRSPIELPGHYFHLNGALRGPTPRHNIPLWLGGTTTPLLELIGRTADGWIAPTTHLRSGELQAANRTIDSSAAAAGRDPREIRRLANLVVGTVPAPGPARTSWISQNVDDLLALALDEGIGTFILESEDQRTIESFAGDIAEALRVAVAAERRVRCTAEGSVRSLFIREKRRRGIDYDNIPESLAVTAIEPGDALYPNVRSTYLRGGSPGLVLRPRTVAAVVDALKFSRAQSVPLSIRSGGHGISGRSTNDGGMVIDLGGMNTLEVLDRSTRRVRVGPGARWSDVAAFLAQYGWGLSSGDYGGVGVGGLATAGGIGWLVREHGLTIDHIRALEIVLADGSIVRATEDDNAELFWGMRGAGANFGIVTSFEFEVDEVADVAFAELIFDASSTATFLERWGGAVESAPRDLTSFVVIGHPRRGRSPIARVTAVVDSSDTDIILDRLRPLAAIAPLLDYSIEIRPYASVMNVPPGKHDAQSDPVTRSALLAHITPEFASAAENLIVSGDAYFFQLRAVGGAVSDVAPDATAYADRSANFQAVAFGTNRQRLDRVWDPMHHFFSGIYINFETDLRPGRIDDAFPPSTLHRLRELKRSYDPANVFRDNFSVTPVRTPS